MLREEEEMVPPFMSGGSGVGSSTTIHRSEPARGDANGQ